MIGVPLGELVYLNYKTEINFNKLILLDVADGPDPDPSQRHKYTYRLHCMASYLMPPWLGTWYLRRTFVNSFLAANPSMKLPLLAKERRENKTYIHSTSCYPYYFFIKAKLIGDTRLSIQDRLNEFDGLPILFIDGNEGEDPIAFYSSKFKKFIDQRDYCKFVEFECHHWIMADKPNELNETVYQFLQK